MSTKNDHSSPSTQFAKIFLTFRFPTEIGRLQGYNLSVRLIKTIQVDFPFKSNFATLRFHTELGRLQGYNFTFQLKTTIQVDPTILPKFLNF